MVTWLNGRGRSLADVFISYARLDRPSVERLADYLTRRGLSVWWDRELTTGSRLRAAIEQELTSAKCVVVVWSVHSVNSHWVIDEAQVGEKRGVLFPIRISDVDPPLGLRQLHTIDLSGWVRDPRRNEREIETLFRDLDRFLQYDPKSRISRHEATRQLIIRKAVSSAKKLGLILGGLAALVVVVATLEVERTSKSISRTYCAVFGCDDATPDPRLSDYRKTYDEVRPIIGDLTTIARHVGDGERQFALKLQAFVRRYDTDAVFRHASVQGYAATYRERLNDYSTKNNDATKAELRKAQAQLLTAMEALIFNR
jgi:hypothetical protein